MPSTAFKNLVSEPVQWMICNYSRSHALGWHGPEANIKLNHNLFVNFDFNDTSPRPPPKLVVISSDLAFINITPERLHTALKRYFYLNALHNKDVASWSTWNEDTGVYTLTQDEAGADELAEQDATEFINNHITPKAFVPDAEKLDSREFAMAEAA